MMKRAVSIMLALLMIITAIGCIRMPSEGISEAEKAKRAEYYKTWADSDDFGTESEYVRIDLEDGDEVFSMEMGKSYVIVDSGAAKAEFHEKDGKTYFYVEYKGQKGWTVSDTEENSSISDMLGDVSFEDSSFADIEYVETIKEGDIEYDVLKAKTTELFTEEGEELELKLYVNAKTHKLAMIRFSKELEILPPTTPNSAVGEKKTLLGSVTFIPGEDSFEIPADAKELSYEEASMAFLLSLFAVMSETAIASTLG